MRKNLMYALVLSGLAATNLYAQPVLQGGVLTDPAGKTLYVFDKDQPDKSNCTGACLQAWPAYTAAVSGTSPLPEVGRLPASGAQQWTWKQRPLYYFAGDAQPGERAGDGSGGVWHIVKPVKASPAATETAPAYKY